MFEMDSREIFWLEITTVALSFIALAIIGVAVLIIGSPVMALVGKLVDAVFATSSVQALWYVTRAAGLTAYLLLWLSTVWGLAVSSKIFDPVLHRFFTFDMHEFLSLLAIGFTALHIVVLLADRYLPFTLAQILVPFIAPYRPLWVGIGIIGLYLTLLVTITFYVRRWIGHKTFRAIHYVSFAAYVAALVHGLMTGTDSSLWTTQVMYAGSALIVIFLFVYRILMALFPSRQSQAI